MDEQTSPNGSSAVDESIVLHLLRSLADREEFGVALHIPEDDDFRFVYVNPPFQALRSDAPMLGRLFSDAWPEAAEYLLPRLREVEESGEPWVCFSHPFRTRDTQGREGVRHFTLHLRRLETGERHFIATTAWDVSSEIEAARSAAAARRDLTRTAGMMRAREHESLLLHGANAILETAITAESEEELGRVCLRVAKETTGSTVGFIGRLSPDGGLEAVAASGVGLDERRGRAGQIPFLPSADAGLFARVLHTGEAVVTNDPAAHPDYAGVPEGHPAIECFLAVPLKRGDATVGVIGVANRPGGYGDDEALLLEELAPSVSGALHSFRASRSLVLSTQMLQAHLTNSPLAVVEFDTELRIIRWSGEAERVFGWQADEVLGRKLAEVPWVYEPDRDSVEAESARLHAGEVSRSKNVNRNLRKDGRVIWCEWYSSVIHDQRGRLTSVLALVHDITDQKEAEERRALQASRMTSLKEIADAASSALVMTEVGQRMAASIASVCACDITVVMLSGDRGALREVASWGVPDALRAVIAQASPGDERSLSRGPHFVSRVAERAADVLPLRALDVAGVASAAWLPLLVDGAPLGGLGLAWRQQHEFDDEEISFLESLAGEVAVGLQNAKLFEAERTRRRRIQELHGVLEVAASSLDPAQAAGSVLDYLAERRAFDLANVWLARGDSLELLAYSNYPEQYRARFSPMTLSAPYDAVRVYKSGETTVEPDIEQANPAVQEMYRSLGVRLGAYVIAPLRSGGMTIGTLNVGWHAPRAIDPSDVAFYESVGSEIGVLLENAELMRERTLQARYAEALNRINEAVHSTLDIDEIMSRVVVDAAQAADADVSAIITREGRDWRYAYTHGLRPEVAASPPTHDEAPMTLRIFTLRKPLAFSRATVGDEASVRMMDRIGVTEAMGVPLLARGDAMGVLLMGRASGGAPYGERQLDFVGKVASTVSLALENARLYQAEHSIADRLQGALLTLPRRVQGIEFAHAYHSATQTARVGGDFYDLFEIEQGAVGIVIGDVAGKGVDAAVLTSLVKNTIRAHATQPDADPAHILGLTNEIVFKSTSLEAFVTVFFAILNTIEGSLVYASAGHTEGIVLRTDGGIASLRVTGPLLGAFSPVRYDRATADLDAGDALFLYTDGVIEARRGDDMFGEERLQEALRRAGDHAPEQLVAGVVDEVTAFAEGRLTDDLAILVVRRIPEDATGPMQQRLEV